MTRTSRKRLPCLASLMLLTAAPHAWAAGLDCSRAEGDTQTAICAHPDLQRLDLRLSAAYGRLIGAQSQQRASIREAQLAWLKLRDQCGAQADCLKDKYQERLGALQNQLREVDAYKPDSVDLQALQDLRAAVEAMRKTDPQFPLEKVLAGLAIKTGQTTFSNVGDSASDDGAHFPTVRPVGVTADEWNALLASRIDGGGENGTASYTLLHIDGNPQRDLVIDSYSGGTGLFTLTSVLRRKGGKFVGAYLPANQRIDANAQASDADTAATDAAADLADGQTALYSQSDRGANQDAVWISLRGRVYAAYRNGSYGQDDVYLLRPLTIVGAVPKLTVHYRYNLLLPKVQKNEDKGTVTTLDDPLYAALTHAVAQLNAEPVKSSGDETKPLCPVPPNVTGDERLEYESYGPGHYSYDIVGDVPVWLGHQCYLGRVVDWFGRYSADGVEAQLWMRKPGDVENTRTFTMHGVRTTSGVDTSVGKVEADNG